MERASVEIADVPLTVEELIAIPYLRTVCVAGNGGLHRDVAWAHSIELPNPWEWVEPGDLVMTVGVGIPEQPEAQKKYVESLARGGASGLAVAEEMQAPPLSRAMLDAADAQDFPLLRTAFEVPWVQVSRAVATAGIDDEHARLVRAMRIYDRMRASVTTEPGSQLLRELAMELRCDLWVRRAEAPTVQLLASGPSMSKEVVTALDVVVDDREAFVGVRRHRVGDGRTLVMVAVPTRRPVSLVVVDHGAGAPPTGCCSTSRRPSPSSWSASGRARRSFDASGQRHSRPCWPTMSQTLRASASSLAMGFTCR